MEESSSSSLDKKGSLPPFIAKCYEMVDDPVTDSILSWTDSGKSFVILDMSLFQQDLLPKYFKHGNFSSFMRQLNTYGFRKSDPDRWEFENSQFIKGQKHLLNNIGRRKNPKGLSQQNESEQKKTSVGACVEVGMFGLHQEVEMLKKDKNVLMQELVKCRQQQNSADYRLICLRQSIKKMEKNQQQMLSLLVMAMQTPGFLGQLLQQNENNWRITETRKKRRLPALEQGTEDEEHVASDGQIVRYQPLSNDASKPRLMPISNMDESEQADPSLNAVDDFFRNIDFMSFGQLLQLPMEADLLSSETNDQFILPDCPEDGMLQDLLLASPRPRDTEEAEPNTPEDLENAMETESNSQDSEMEMESNSQDSEMETTESLDDLAKQMEQLAYGTNSTDEEL